MDDLDQLDPKDFDDFDLGDLGDFDRLGDFSVGDLGDCFPSLEADSFVPSKILPSNDSSGFLSFK